MNASLGSRVGVGIRISANLCLNNSSADRVQYSKYTHTHTRIKSNPSELQTKLHVLLYIAVFYNILKPIL